MEITTIVKNNRAVFAHYRSGKMYYSVVNQDGKALWEFPIDITDTNDIGSATLLPEYKAITLMRYIRKAIASDSLIQLFV